MHKGENPLLYPSNTIYAVNSTLTVTVIGDVSFPGDRFILNGVTDIPTIDIEIKSVVAHVDEGLTPYFWITASDMEEVDQKLTADPTITNIDQLESVDNERLYRAHWISGSQGLVTVLQETEGAITSATFHNIAWRIRFLFKDREQLTACFEQCRDDLAFDIELLGVFDRSTSASSSEYGLTEAQREALQIALAEGYFEVPREDNIDDIAHHLGVSQQAVSQRLRRGYESLVMNTIGVYER